MVRLCLSIILIFAVAGTSAQQAREKIGIFQTEEFIIAADKPRVTNDTIGISGPVDLWFYRRHFNCPYSFPPRFIDSSYRDTTTVSGSDLKGVVGSTYDSEGRIVKWTYYGCTLCSSLPYSILIYYDSLNRVSKMEQFFGSYRPGEAGTLSSKAHSYLIRYNKAGEIGQIDRYNSDVLAERITWKK